MDLLVDFTDDASLLDEIGPRLALVDRLYVEMWVWQRRRQVSPLDQATRLPGL